MRTVPLDMLLDMDSTDAPCYKVCDNCGNSWQIEWDYNTPPCSNGCPEEYERDGLTVRDTLVAKRRDGQYVELCSSLDRTGMNTPILVRNETVCNGHHRIAWAEERGLLDIKITGDYYEYDSAESKSPW